ncbi:hypothetical protein [Bacteroides sp. UBA939]|uniref:hypothetical protein n=1 Tax=Bacteroides sp. UBA939 TaxID=1946092 RepID=UPI0025C04AD4|nr:hypothetical protein [Bacteroides sp. UBA939]
MNRELKLNDDCANNVESVKISEKTKALLLYRARLSDIYENVVKVVYHRYSTDMDETFPGFWDVYNKFDVELMKVISHFIEVTSVESNYKEI